MTSVRACVRACKLASYRIEGEHAAHEVYGLVRGVRRETVERAHRFRFVALAQYVLSRRLARVLHLLKRRRAD